MDILPDKQSHSTITIAQFDRLADIIFALAMAQTVLGFQIPETATSMIDSEVIKFLIAQLEPLMTYAITFVIVAIYWIEHRQQFRYYQRTDDTLVWLSILYLMCLFIVPYSNALVMHFSDNYLVKILFSINIFLIGIFSFGSWFYATYQHRLVDEDLDNQTIIKTKIRALIEPGISILTIVVALFNQYLWDYVWFITPVIYIAVDKFLPQSQSN
jgi:uncharacterized membrane protein